MVKEKWRKQIFNIGSFAVSDKYKKVFNGKRNIVLGEANKAQIQALIEIGTLDVSKLEDKAKKGLNDTNA